MAKYKLTKSAYVGGQYYEASATQPVVVEVGDDVTPSRTWEALDDAARAALGRLEGLTVEAVKPLAAVKPKPAPAAVPEVPTPPKPKRPPDKE